MKLNNLEDVDYMQLIIFYKKINLQEHNLKKYQIKLNKKHNNNIILILLEIMILI